MFDDIRINPQKFKMQFAEDLYV